MICEKKIGQLPRKNVQFEVAKKKKTIIGHSLRNVVDRCYVISFETFNHFHTKNSQRFFFTSHLLDCSLAVLDELLTQRANHCHLEGSRWQDSIQLPAKNKAIFLMLDTIIYVKYKS